MSRNLIALLIAGAAAIAVASPASAAIEIETITFNPRGPDNGSNKHLNKEYVFIRNTGSHKRSLKGWKLSDRGRDHVFKFPDIVLRRGEYLRVHTGRGADTAGEGCNGHCTSFHDLHWRLEDYAWENRSDVATVRNRSGTIVDRCRYVRSDTSPKEC